MKKQFSYLGLDAHSDHCQLAAMSPQGNLLFCRSYKTSASELIEAVTQVKGPKKMVVEESQMADWIKRSLEPYVDELTIADPKANAWITKAQHMDDHIAAVRLTELLRGGYIHPVHHGDSQRQRFKELVLHYHDITKQMTRFKNKLKGEFIAKAITVKGIRVYDPKYFPGYVKSLKSDPQAQFQAQNYFTVVQQLRVLQAKTLKQIRGYYSQYPEVRRFSKIPGLGQISSFTISAIVDTPYRFANKRKLWSYCCLAKADKISNGKFYRSGPSHQGHRLLKYIFLSAARTIMASKKDSFYKRAAERLLKQGVTVKNIRRTVARQIASSILKIWKTGEPYRDMN